MIHYHIVTA